MCVHELKTWPEYFKAVYDGSKTFEVRKNDRNYQVGDELILCEYNPETEAYTGSSIKKIVTYILDKPPFVSDGYVVMSIKDKY